MEVPFTQDNISGLAPTRMELQAWSLNVQSPDLIKYSYK